LKQHLTEDGQALVTSLALSRPFRCVEPNLSLAGFNFSLAEISLADLQWGRCQTLKGQYETFIECG
jgi:hypothetical protein